VHANLSNTPSAQRARLLLDRSEQVIASMPQLGYLGFGWTDIQIEALRGNAPRALEKLRRSTTNGLRVGWRYYRDLTPTSPRSATSPNSKPCSPTSNATWRKNAPASPHDRRMRRLY
jgi:hypothetical protein